MLMYIHVYMYIYTYIHKHIHIHSISCFSSYLPVALCLRNKVLTQCSSRTLTVLQVQVLLTFPSVLSPELSLSLQQYSA